MTDRLTVTAGGRFNYAGISIDGQNNALLNGFSNFFHVNPTVGFTYKLTPDINFYAGYAMTNRAPTPLELGCADPNNPCIIDNFLSSDPKLKQVVGQTFELGFRGQNAFNQFGLGPQWGKLQWSAGLFRTTLNNDILPHTEPGQWFRLFANVGTTLRQGAEVSANWTGRPVVGLRQLHLSRRRLSFDLLRAVGVQSVGGRQRRISRLPTARRSPAFPRTR